MEKRPALGKGLSALIPDLPPAPAPASAPVDLAIDELAPNDYQPRAHFDDARLDELAASIRANGIIQPIVVSRSPKGFRIIAGERRWRAAKMAGLARVPIVVKESGADAPQSLLQLALIENIQRENLNPIDEAKAYRRLADEFRQTQDTIATSVGKERATVANTLRLLKLPEEIQHDLIGGAITTGHARALLALATEASQLALAREVKTRGLSVRETEALVKARLAGEGETPGGSKAAAVPAPPDIHTRAAEEKLRLHLGTRVRIVRKGQAGRIEIEFTSENELIRLYDVLVGE